MADDAPTATPAADPIATPEPVATPAPTPAAEPTRRFTAPADLSAITLSTGRVFTIADGAIETPDDLIPDELAALAQYGFFPAA